MSKVINIGSPSRGGLRIRLARREIRVTWYGRKYTRMWMVFNSHYKRKRDPAELASGRRLRDLEHA